MIKNIIFDMGNVLLDFEPDKYVKELGLNNKEEEWKIYKATYMTIKSALIDKGKYNEKELIDAILDDIGEEYRKYIEKLILHWSDNIKPVSGMANIVKELKDQGYKIYLLSNAGYRQHEYWEKIPGHEYFDGTVISCDVKAIKPEKEIYEALYKKFNLNPKECFFIDDLVINIYGARQTGMDGFVFTGKSEDLRKEFEKRGILK